MVSKSQSVNSNAVEHETGELFGMCLQAFQAFSGLPELSEDMRVLSLNAELAAGRGGEKGVAVRALTQYTRELVYRLNGICKEILSLKSQMYRHSAGALRVLRQNGMMERASLAVQEAHADAERSMDTQRHIGDTQQEFLDTTLDEVGNMVNCVNQLFDTSKNVSGVGTQAASISTNIAIEAALSGQFEEEFRQVADAMQEYVDQLRDMADTGGRSIRDAISIGQNLQQRASVTLSVR